MSLNTTGNNSTANARRIVGAMKARTERAIINQTATQREAMQTAQRQAQAGGAGRARLFNSDPSETVPAARRMWGQ